MHSFVVHNGGDALADDEWPYVSPWVGFDAFEPAGEELEGYAESLRLALADGEEPAPDVTLYSLTPIASVELVEVNGDMTATVEWRDTVEAIEHVVKMRDTLRDLVGDHCPEDEKPDPACPRCAALALVGAEPPYVPLGMEAIAFPQSLHRRGAADVARVADAVHRYPDADPKVRVMRVVARLQADAAHHRDRLVEIADVLGADGVDPERVLELDLVGMARDADSEAAVMSNVFRAVERDASEPELFTIEHDVWSMRRLLEALAACRPLTLYGDAWRERIAALLRRLDEHAGGR